MLPVSKYNFYHFPKIRNALISLKKFELLQRPYSGCRPNTMSHVKNNCIRVCWMCQAMTDGQLHKLCDVNIFPHFYAQLLDPVSVATSPVVKLHVPMTKLQAVPVSRLFEVNSCYSD